MNHTEQQLENACCLFARSKGIAAVKLEKVKGLPDRLFIQEGGRCLFVEFKRPDKKGVISPEQFQWAAYLADCHLFVDSYDDFVLQFTNYFNVR